MTDHEKFLRIYNAYKSRHSSSDIKDKSLAPSEVLSPDTHGVPSFSEDSPGATPIPLGDSNSELESEDTSRSDVISEEQSLSDRPSEIVHSTDQLPSLTSFPPNRTKIYRRRNKPRTKAFNLPVVTENEKRIAEKIITIIESEIRLTKPCPTQRQTYLRLTPSIPDQPGLRAYIVTAVWVRYKVKVVWEYNMDITLNLYPDY